MNQDTKQTTTKPNPPHHPLSPPIIPPSLQSYLFFHSLTNNILTPLLPNPHLMDLPRRDIDPRPHAVRLLDHLAIVQFRVVLRVRDGQGAAADEVGGDAGVGVGWVVCVAV